VDVKTVCLGILNFGDASGYEIKKALEEGPFAHIHAASYGSIYPALNALSAQGYAECRQMTQDKRPDKKIYSITDAGRRALQESLLVTPAPDSFRSDFLFILFFAELLPPDRLAELIDQRIAWYRENLERMEQCNLESPGHSFVHGMGQAIYRAAAEYLERNRDQVLENPTVDDSGKETTTALAG